MCFCVAVDHNQAILLELLDHRLLLFVHLAAPCDMANRARRIKPGIAGPDPLRDESHFSGKPGFKGPDYDWLQIASRLFDFPFMWSCCCANAMWHGQSQTLAGVCCGGIQVCLHCWRMVRVSMPPFTSVCGVAHNLPGGGIFPSGLFSPLSRPCSHKHPHDA